MNLRFWFGILFSVVSTKLFAAPVLCIHIPKLREIYTKQHYAVKTINAEINKRTVEQYLKSLDGSKTLLLESDVSALRKKLTDMLSNISSGSCQAIEDAAGVLKTRAAENEAFVKTYLGADYKLDENTEIILNPKKREHPKTKEERENFLKKFIHFQISNYLLTDIKLADAKKQLIHRYELITKRVSEVSSSERLASFLDSFANALDPHSSFLSSENLEDFQIQMQLSLEGIGATLSSDDGYTVIEALVPGGSADKLKLLRPKDKIISVAQDGQKPVSVIDMDLKEVVRLIRGKKGTKVKLTILRQAATTSTFDVTIVRDKIDIKESAAKITYEDKKVGEKTYKIGILDLPSFYGGGGSEGRYCSKDVKALLVEAKSKNVDGILLNLSSNGGGILEEAVKIAGFFIKTGGVVATKNSEAKVDVLSDSDSEVIWDGPLAVLTSRISASASEIVAGALRDYNRGLIVGGDHTFGKGTVQAVLDLPLRLGALKITTGMFFIPKGDSTQHKGVAAHVTLPAPFKTDEIGENKLDYALPAQSVKNFVSESANVKEGVGKWLPIQDKWLSDLQKKSDARVAKNDKFKEMKKNLEEAEKNNGTIKLAELRKKSLEEKKKEKDKKDALAKANKGKKVVKGSDGEEPTLENKDDLKEIEKPLVDEGVNVLADLIANIKLAQ